MTTTSGSLRVRVITPYPFSLLFGGREVQAIKYVEHVRNEGVDIHFIDMYNPADQYDLLHVVGLTVASSDIIETAKHRNMKVLLSPVYYAEGLRYLGLNALLRLTSSQQLTINRIKAAIQGADLLLPNSAAEKEQLEKMFSVRGRAFEVVHNGVDAPRPDVDGRHFREMFGIAEDYILSVSMFDKRKNTLRLLKAFLALDTKRILVLVGDVRFANSAYFSEIRQLIAENPKRIRHVGLVSDTEIIASAYAGAALHALPSILETPGLSNLEAASYGCNIVVGDCDPVREYFEDAAFYCNPRSVDSIRDALRQAEREDRRQATRKMSEKYYWPRIAKELAAIYRRSAGT